MSKLFANTLGLLPLSVAASLNGFNRSLGNTLLRRGPVATRIRTRNRNTGVRLTRTQRRNLRRRRNAGIEINRAEGGFKNITIPFRTQGIGVNTYARLAVVKTGDTWSYAFQPESDNYANHQEFNLIYMLNNSTEFTNRLKTTSQYKLLGIRICVMNNRIPEAKDTLSKLLLYVNTSKVSVNDPKIQNNVMQLNMNTIGTKNFNFNVNTTNMGKDFIGWLNGDTLYPGNIYIHVDSMDKNVMADTTQTTIMLGTIKVTFNILTRIQDYTRNLTPTRKETVQQNIDRLEHELSKAKLLKSQPLETPKEEPDDSGSEYEGDEEFIESLKGA
jgi:hypothetical protein